MISISTHQDSLIVLSKLLTISRRLIYREVATAAHRTTIILPTQLPKKSKKLSPRSCADLTFRIQMCLANGQAYEFQNRQNDLAPIPPLMQSIIRDLNKLRKHAPEEELKFRYMLSQIRAPATPEASAHFAEMANKAKIHTSLYNETIAVE